LLASSETNRNTSSEDDHLYQIETELRQQRTGVTARDAFRSTQSCPIIQRIRGAQEQWQKLGTSCPKAAWAKRSATLWVDGNHWLFFGDANAGERSAVIYSIIESCRRNEVEAGHRAISTHVR
jgi:transposase